MSSGIVFHALAALAYALPGAALWRTLMRGGPVAGGKAASAMLALALILQAIALQQSALAGTTMQLSWSLALSTAVWLGMLVFWLESLLVRTDGLQLLLLPLAALCTLLAALFPDPQLVAHADNPWLRIHLLIALASYGLITVAALHSVLMALLDRHLHRPMEPLTDDRKGLGNIIDRVLDSMPPLLVQEQILFRLIWVGFVMLTLAVGSGSVISLSLTGQVLPFDHKTVFTLLSWITFGVLLIGRHARGWRGRVALRWTLTGFCFLLLAYTGTRFVLEVVLHRG